MKRLTPQQVADHEATQIEKNKDYDPAADAVVRSSGLGGSDMAVVLGISEYKSPLQLYHEKRGTWPEEFNEDLSLKEPVRIGKHVEDDICLMFAEDHDLKIRRYRKTPRHPVYQWAMAHPDRQVVGKFKGKKAVMEAKLTVLRHHWGDPGTDEIAEYFLPQVHQEIWLTDAELCIVPVWFVGGFGGIQREVFFVERDEEWFDILQQKGDAFWRCVLTGEEPVYRFDDAVTQTAIRKVYREQFTEDSFVNLGQAGQTITDVRHMLNERAKQYKDGVDAHTAMLDELMGDAQFGMLPDGRWWRRKLIEKDAYEVEASSYVDMRIIKKLPKGVQAPIEFHGWYEEANRLRLSPPELSAVDNKGLSKLEQQFLGQPKDA